MEDDSKRGDAGFETWRVADLKKFLKERDQCVSGRKDDLVRRAQGCVALGIGKGIGAETFERGHGSVLHRKLTPLQTATGQSMPHPDTLQNWREFAEFPAEFAEKDLYNYLVLSRHQTIDERKMGATRQLKGRTMFKEGHVHAAMYHPIQDACDHCFIKAKVIPSLPGRDVTKTPDHNTWICLSKVTGHVHSADCSCTAGEGGSCNHIAAVLYLLADMVEKKKSGLGACTSLPCTWGVPKRQRVTSPKKVTDRPLRRAKNMDGKSKEAVIDVKSLREKLVKCAPQCGYVLSTSDIVEKTSPRITLNDPEFMFRDSINLSSQLCVNVFTDYVSSLSKPNVAEVEQMTRGQGHNLMWAAARQGRITSSKFGQVCLKKKDTAPDSLLKDIMGYREVPNVKSVKWGRSHEAAARRMYFCEHSKDHPHMEVADCGLVIHSDCSFLACSPDGLVSCPECKPSLGLVEVKCPFSHRNSTVREACQDSTFCCSDIDGVITLKTSHQYYYQIQGQMGVTGHTWCDFVVWTLKDMSVQRIFFDAHFWSSMLEKLKQFFLQGVVPEIFSRRVQRNKPLY